VLLVLLSSVLAEAFVKSLKHDVMEVVYVGRKVQSSIRSRRLHKFLKASWLEQLEDLRKFLSS